MDKDKVKEQVDNKINEITNEGVQQGNIDYLGKLVDIKKDLGKIEKLEMEEKDMYYRTSGRSSGSYGNYGEYSGGRSRDSMGRYTEGGSYGRRERGRYRGEEMIDEMATHYGNYMEGKENYGGMEVGKALDYMLMSVEEFMNMLKDDAGSQEEVEKIRRTARKIAEM